ncbi:MAG: ABC transporter ATP-binding protein [Clostridia bacterium]|nr:ABC transporter ATP-binding protein [Clostridia bacterium]
MTLIKCTDLSIGYDNSVVLEAISFEVCSGDYLCVVGENGAGKSTLIRTLLGLQKPLGGSISFSGGLRQTEIGYLPQQTVVQRDFPASVTEIVMSGFVGANGRRPFYTRGQKAKARMNIERMGLQNLVRRCYRELSGGQQQRVLLARALCATDKLILLDEPTAGLDPRVTAGMYQVIKELNDEGITVIMISHDLTAALEYASHILHVGRETFFGSKEDYVSSGFCERFLKGSKASSAS